jgi:hypothetical protein
MTNNLKGSEGGSVASERQGDQSRWIENHTDYLARVIVLRAMNRGSNAFWLKVFLSRP